MGVCYHYLSPYSPESSLSDFIWKLTDHQAPYKRPGRVGDTPLWGSGGYAEDGVGVACTGYGEDLVKYVYNVSNLSNVANMVEL